MSRITRRTFLQASAVGACGAQACAVTPLMAAAGPQAASMKQGPAPRRMIEEWMNEWMYAPADPAKAPVGPLHLTRFADPTYVLTQSIGWKPNADQEGEFEAVTVPKGFVTDFASVPQAFWSQLRPDGQYTYAAIVHDYLYWFQTRPRVVADEIFRLAMADFSIDTLTLWTVYGAVRVAGGLAWRKNARLKSEGEKRILKKTPDDPTVTWEAWRQMPDVFE